MLGALALLLVSRFGLQAAADVLIVADEIPAMEVLAQRLKSEEAVGSRIVRQTQLPDRLEGFRAVVVYLHGALEAAPEAAMIRYATNGGRLVALHHSISSGKRTNENWFSFLGIELPKGEADQGGYKWIEPAPLTVLNLRPDHFINRHKLAWPDRQEVARLDGGGGEVGAFTLAGSEVYLNHVVGGTPEILLGMRYRDASGRLWEQATAGWYRRVGQGWVFYFMPGHAVEDFRHPVFGRVVMNAIIWKPPDGAR